jgi:hypothetical protein
MKLEEDVHLSPQEEAYLLQHLPYAPKIAPSHAEIAGEVLLPLRWLMGVPFVPVYIEGREHLLQFDPGSRVTFIYPTLARRLSGLALISEEAGIGESLIGKYRYYRAQLREIRLGSARVSHDVVTIPMLKTLAKLFGLLTVYEYPGLLGLRTLKPFSVTIDLMRSQVILRPKSSPAPVGALAIPFELRPQLPDHDNNLLLVTYLNGQGPFRLILDPGAGMTVIALRVARHLGLDPQQPLRLDIEVEGQQIAKGLGALARQLLEEAKMEDGTVIDGLLGRNWLRHWVVTIDFERQLLYLEKPRAQQR